MTQRLLTGIVLLALVLRLLAMWVLEPTPLYTDENVYYKTAFMLRHESLDWFFDTSRLVPMNKPPGSFSIYAMWMYLFGDSVRAIRLLNVAAGAAAPLLGYILGNRLGGERTGLVAALLLAVHPNLVLYCTGMWSETTYNFIVLLFFVCLTSERKAWWKYAMVSGVLLAMATYIRETGLFLPALGLGWGAWRYSRGLPAVRGVALAAAAFILLCAPWSIRLNLEPGPTRQMSRNSAWNLYLGNSDNNPPYKELHKNRVQRDLIANRRARESIKERMPAWPVEKLFTATRFFLVRNTSVRRLISPADSRYRLRGRWPWTESPTLRNNFVATMMAVESMLAAIGTGGLFLMALAGTRRIRVMGWILIASILLHYFPAWLTFAVPRFGMPCTPIFLLGAAWVMTRGGWGWRRASWPAIAAAAVAAAGMLLLQTGHVLQLWWYIL